MRRRREAGQIIPLIAISMTAIMGFGGMAVDHGYWQYQLRQQQNAADGAAIGGAQALALAGCPNQTAAYAAADSDASSNGFTNGVNGVTVTPNNPPQGGPYASNNCAVSVTIAASHPAFFARVLGFKQMNESTTATAQIVSNNNSGFVGLSQSSTSTYTGSISGSGVNFYSNGSITCGSNTINVGAMTYGKGKTVSCSNATFSAATPSPTYPVPNPCPEIAGCNYLTNNPPPVTNCQSLQSGNMNPTISPGCYNNLSVGGCGTVTLQPGTYVLNGTSNFAGSSFVGSGVTFYVTASATPPDFSTANSATISPPTTGSQKGVLYYQVSSNSGAPNFAGSSVHWNGLVYAPTANNVNFNGAKGDYTLLVVGSANLDDSSGYTFATPAPGSSLLHGVVLGQ